MHETTAESTLTLLIQVMAKTTTHLLRVFFSLSVYVTGF